MVVMIGLNNNDKISLYSIISTYERVPLFKEFYYKTLLKSFIVILKLIIVAFKNKLIYFQPIKDI